MIGAGTLVITPDAKYHSPYRQEQSLPSNARERLARDFKPVTS